MDNLSYLLAGRTDVPTSSSVLRSSSQYLNHAGIREWVATQYLRRNGPDRPTYGDSADVLPALAELKDQETILQLISYEKTINPRFAAWVEEAYISPLTKADFITCAPGTVGGIYGKYLLDHGFELNLAREMIKPRNDFEFIRFRFGQIHDYEHIIAGGGFDTLGEIMPYFVRQSAMYRHLSPLLAAQFADIYVLGGYRLLVRCGLNYPQAYPTALDCMARAIRIGTESEPIFMSRFEDVLDLSPEEARRKLGIRHAEDLDTAAMSAIFDDVGGGLVKVGPSA